MRITRIAWVALFLLIGGTQVASPASAAFSVFTSQAAFFASTRIASTETFEEFPSGSILGTGSAVVDGVTYTTANPSNRLIVNKSFLPGNTANVLVGGDDIDARTLTFGTGLSSNAIGFSLSTSAYSPIPTYRIVATAADGEQYSELLSFTAAAPIYRGFANPGGIVSVTITPINTGGGTSNYNFDNVSRGSIVPEPASITLLGLGAVGLFGSLRRRRRSRVG